MRRRAARAAVVDDPTTSPSARPATQRRFRTVLSGSAPLRKLGSEYLSAFTGFLRLICRPRTTSRLPAASIGSGVEHRHQRARQPAALGSGQQYHRWLWAAIVAHGLVGFIGSGPRFHLATAIKTGVGIFPSPHRLVGNPGRLYQSAAGNNITVNGGFVHTTGGAHCRPRVSAASIPAPNERVSVQRIRDPVDAANLGGISTANGGNVTLLAGADVISYLPTLAESNPDDGGFGAAAGPLARRRAM